MGFGPPESSIMFNLSIVMNLTVGGSKDRVKPLLGFGFLGSQIDLSGTINHDFVKSRRLF